MASALCSPCYHQQQQHRYLRSASACRRSGTAGPSAPVTGHMGKPRCGVANVIKLIGSNPAIATKGYKYIVNVEYCSPVSSDGPHFPSGAARAKEAAQSIENTKEYHQMMEEEVIHGLQRVDVNFHASLWPYSAHNNIHVKNEWLHNAGAGVTAHVADSIKQRESRTCFPANL